MLQDAAAALDAQPPGNAAQAVEQLTQHAQKVMERVSQLVCSVQEVSRKQAGSTSAQLAMYGEAVDLLQVMPCRALQLYQG